LGAVGRQSSPERNDGGVRPGELTLVAPGYSAQKAGQGMGM
jgi:hypothetical protein